MCSHLSTVMLDGLPVPVVGEDRPRSHSPVMPLGGWPCVGIRYVYFLDTYICTCTLCSKVNVCCVKDCECRQNKYMTFSRSIYFNPTEAFCSLTKTHE